MRHDAHVAFWNTFTHIHTYTDTHTCTHLSRICMSHVTHVKSLYGVATVSTIDGWLRLVRSIKLQVFFYRMLSLYRALLQKRHMIYSILLTKATPYLSNIDPIVWLVTHVKGFYLSKIDWWRHAAHTLTLSFFSRYLSTTWQVATSFTVFFDSVYYICDVLLSWDILFDHIHINSYIYI